MKIVVIGTGYVGLVSGTCFAEIGHEVICVDYDLVKINGLIDGVMPIYEPGLEEMVVRNFARGNLKFSSNIAEAIKDAEIVIIAVGTPTNSITGKVDLSYINAAAEAIKANLGGDVIVIMKSTVPVGTCAGLSLLLNTDSKYICRMVSNPEFLREGHAIDDFLNPERIVIGSDSEVEGEIRQLYADHLKRNIPILFGNFPTAELIKYAANTALAAKVALMNEIACISERVGADITKIVEGVGLDSRIGNKFLSPGPGFGGSCFPKDTKALLQIAEEVDFEGYLIRAITKSNENHMTNIVSNISKICGDLSGKIITILGVTYKANTDDVRSSPAINIINHLLEMGAVINIYDPEGMSGAKNIWGAKINYCKDPYAAAKNSNLAVILTEWVQFKEIDYKKLSEEMLEPKIYDLRNVIDIKEPPKGIKLYKLGING